MQALIIIYSLIGITTAISQYLLYKSNAKNYIYFINLAISFFLGFISFTSFPSNDVSLKILSIVFALIGASAIYFKSVSENTLYPKYILSFSIIASFALILI